MNHKTEVSYHNDVFFKYALAGDDEDSKYLRHAIIQELTGIHVIESIVLNPEVNATLIHKKNIVLDIHVRDEKGREYDFEMQVAGNKRTEMKRFEYYGVKMLSDQLSQGDAYEDLQPVYQIIFMDMLGRNRQELVTQYQMRDQRGENEQESALLHRIYIYLPAINTRLKEKDILELNAFEQLCYLFKNDENHAILKTKERLVKKLMEKHEQMRDDRSIWSIARAQQIGERRYENIKRDCYDEGIEVGKAVGKAEGIKMGKAEGIEVGKAVGKAEGIEVGKAEGIEMGKAEGKMEGEALGYQNILVNQIKSKYHVDANEWLITLSKEELTKVSNAIFDANTFEELKGILQ